MKIFKMKEIKQIESEKWLKFDAEIIRIGNEAVRKAKEDNRKHGLPEVFVKGGKLYYLLPNGEVTDVRPDILK